MRSRRILRGLPLPDAEDEGIRPFETLGTHPATCHIQKDLRGQHYRWEQHTQRHITPRKTCGVSTTALRTSLSQINACLLHGTVRMMSAPRFLLLRSMNTNSKYPYLSRLYAFYTKASKFRCVKWARSLSVENLLHKLSWLPMSQ
jgi:hypothetical protein